MTIPASKRNTGFKMLLSTACVFFVIWGLRSAGSFLVPIILGFFLAMISLPITGWLRRRRIPGVAAVLMTVILEAAILTGVIFLIASIMPDFQKSAERFELTFRTMAIERAGEFQQTMTEQMEAFQKWVDPAAASETPDPETTTEAYDLAVAVEQLLSFESAIWVVNFVGNTGAVQWTAGLIAKTFIAFIIMIFVLVESNRFAEKLKSMDLVKGPSFEGFRNAGSDLQRYLGIKTLVSLATGFLAWLSCWLIGVEFPVIWGLLAFLLNYIPTIGSIAAGIIPSLVALVQLGPGWAVAVALCYVGINSLLGSFIEPVLLGNRFGLSTVMVLVSVLFWGWVWGPVGMFLAVPLTMMIKIMMEQSDDFRWVSVLISQNAPEDDREKEEEPDPLPAQQANKH
ncbi:MAG: AI-2E family transporter, partial [Verrucomicrobiota bacterium]